MVTTTNNNINVSTRRIEALDDIDRDIVRAMNIAVDNRPKPRRKKREGSHMPKKARNR